MSRDDFYDPASGDDYFHMVAIDPGSHMLGVAVYTLTPTLQIVSIAAQTVCAEHLSEVQLLGQTDGALLCRLAAMQTVLSKIFRQYEPSHVVHEGMFINRLRPEASIVLTKVIQMILITAVTVLQQVDISSIQPTPVKKAVGAEKYIGKDAMRLALSQHIELAKHVDASQQDEHAIDAVAVGFAKLIEMRKELASYA